MSQHSYTAGNFSFDSQHEDRANNLNPPFNDSGFTPAGLMDHIKNLKEQNKTVSHQQVLAMLLEKVEPVDFSVEAELPENKEPKKNHFVIISSEQVIRLARENNWGICMHHGFIYGYNGEYWSQLEDEELKSFLGQAAERMGVDKFQARYHTFKKELYEQFVTSAFLQKPKRPEGAVFVNLKNGTFEITPEKQFLRTHRREDFLTYQLPFNYDPEAKAPLFEKYLNRVLPDMELQNILSEYLGYIFIHPSTLKLEKILLLYGSGANGKSVLFEIVSALLGPENLSNYSLQSLTNEKGYQRAKLENKLVNYASEINGKLETSFFKQLVSGEPIEARLPYGQPLILSHYAKLIFNCNELPKDVEHTHAYFRRFIIIPFEVTIPEEEQDKELPQKIISSELSGVFNWVLKGLNRLIAQKKFSESEAVRQQLEDYKKQSDSVRTFLDEEGYRSSETYTIPQKDLYQKYRAYCFSCGYSPCSDRTFGGRLKNAGFATKRMSGGNVVYADFEPIF